MSHRTSTTPNTSASRHRIIALCLAGTAAFLAAACRVAPTPVPAALPAATTAAPAASDPGAAPASTAPIDVQSLVPLATGDTVLVDPASMADMPCHAMGNVVMGQCAPDDIDRLIGGLDILPVDTETMAEAPCHVMAGSIMGTCSEDDVQRLRREHAIIVNPAMMSDFPCHAMGNTIMGACSAADVERVRQEIRSLRETGSVEPGADVEPVAAGFRPGERDVRAFEPPPAEPMTAVDLRGIASFALEAVPVRWTVGDATVWGYGYNGQVPGPLLKVRQGSTLRVDFRNGIDMPTTVHWHGLRHANASDGVPGVTQDPVEPGASFTYDLTFPDAGLYWYHPHVREDVQQDAGLAGTILVEPPEAAAWPPVDREEVLVLDDVRIEDGQLAPYGLDHPNFAIMGRFGNTLLVNGRPSYALDVEPGQVVRFFVVNTAGARPFRLSFDGAAVQRIAGDLGRYANPTMVDDIVIGPAERTIVDVRFDEARSYRLRHTTPAVAYDLGTIESRRTAETAAGAGGNAVARDADVEVARDIDRFRSAFDRAPDMDLEITAEIAGLIRAKDIGASPAADASGAAATSSAGTSTDDHHAAGDGLEWEDDMLAVNRRSDTEGVRWILRDRATGAENHDLHPSFRVGDVIKVRLFNDPDGPHPMHHPVHIHGQRFLVSAIDGHPNPDLVWKDTVLVPRGGTVDLIVDITNPGAWMVHCHIPEHMESGMMFQMDVEGGATSPAADPHAASTDTH